MNRTGLISPSRIAVLVCLTLSSTSRADDTPAHLASSQFEIEANAQYYVPLHDDRQIRSVFVDLLIGRKLVPIIGLSGYVGITSTHAWGSIVQYGERFQDVRYSTSVVGFGPVFLLRMQPLRLGPVSLGLDAVGSLILYNHHFPPGGDIYNFSWRVGPSMKVQILDRLAGVAGFRWMHVSNGQGLGPQNPSYEGAGGSIDVVAGF